MVGQVSWSIATLSFANLLVAEIAKHASLKEEKDEKKDEIPLSKINILDVSIGRGYWSYLFHKAGANVLAVNSHAEFYKSEDEEYKKNDGKYIDTWFPVTKYDSAEFIKENAEMLKDYVLFFSWDRNSIRNCLEHYKGRYLIIVGEGDGGCTGSIELEELQKFDKNWKEFDLPDRFELPRWSGINDFITFYFR
jgi:hypothetical protein